MLVAVLLLQPFLVHVRMAVRGAVRVGVLVLVLDVVVVVGGVRVRVRDAWAQAPRTGQLCAGASDGEGKAPRLAPAKAAQGPTHHGGTARYHATCGRGETPGKGPRHGSSLWRAMTWHTESPPDTRRHTLSRGVVAEPLW